MKKRFLTIVVAMLMIVTLLPVTVFAVEKENNGIKVTQTTNKTKYAAGEDIVVNVTVENNNSAGFNIKNLKIVNSIPAGYKLVAPKTEEIIIDLLEAGKTSQLATEYIPEVEEVEDIADTADTSFGDALLYMAVAVMCVPVILVLNKSNKINKKVITMSLCCLLAFALFATSGVVAVGEENPDNKIVVSSKVMVEDEEVEVITTVTYDEITTPEYTVDASVENEELATMSVKLNGATVTGDIKAKAGDILEFTLTKTDKVPFITVDWKGIPNDVEYKISEDKYVLTMTMPACDVEVFAVCNECLAAGTPITLATGETKLIEELNRGDLVRVFNHETGEVDSAKLYDVWKYPEQHKGAFTMHFSNDIDVTVVGGHCFFDKDLNKYIAINLANIDNFIGHSFYNVDLGEWETLDGYDLIVEPVDSYVIATEKHFNCVANGMLSSEDGIYELFINTFDYGEGLKVDQAKKAADIEKYGLWSADNLKYFSINAYDAHNLQYLNVLFGKGVFTPKLWSWYEAYGAEIDPELYCN